MSVFEKLTNNIIDEIRQTLKKYNISPQDYLLTPTDPRAHRDIMNIFAKTIHNQKEQEAVSSINREMMIDIAKSSKDDNCKLRDDYRYSIIARQYLNEFLGNFFLIENKEAKLTNVEEFQLPDMSDKFDRRKNMEYINSKIQKIDPEYRNEMNGDIEICMLILPDGTSYFSPRDHETLARWLNVNGINIDKSVRYESKKSLYDFSISSLHNKILSKSSNSDKLIEITREQVDVLSKMYGTLLSGWTWMKPLDSQLKLSDGFGIGKKEVWNETSDKNIKRIHNYMDEYFNLGEYKREMGLSNDAHFPLN